MRPEMAFASLRECNPKTETRRPLKPEPPSLESVRKLSGTDFGINPASWDNRPYDFVVTGPVWAVREALNLSPQESPKWKCEYRAGERRCILTTWAVHRDLDHLKPTELPVATVSRPSAFWHAGMGPKPEHAGELRSGRFLPNALRHLMPAVDIVSVRAEPLNHIAIEGAEREGLSRYSKDGTLYKYGIADYDGIPGEDDLGWHWVDWRISPVDAYERLWENINGAGSWAKNPWVWVIEFKRVT